MIAEERNRKVVDNLGLVYITFNKYLKGCPFRLVGDAEDYVQEGVLTLLKAVEKFDPSKGFEFSTYACSSVRKALNRLFQTMGLIRTPEPQDVKHEGPRRRARGKARRIYSLSEKDARGGHGLRMEQIPDPLAEEALRRVEEPNPNLEAERLILRISTVRRQRAVRMRFLEGQKLWRIGNRLGVSKERARQLVQSGRAEMRNILEREEWPHGQYQHNDRRRGPGPPRAEGTGP